MGTGLFCLKVINTKCNKSNHINRITVYFYKYIWAKNKIIMNIIDILLLETSKTLGIKCIHRKKKKNKLKYNIV